MKLAAKILSYLFHPVIIPTIGTLLYYIITPQYIQPKIQKAIIISIIILTIIVPIIIYALFKNIGWLDSAFITSVAQRKIPVLIIIFLLYIVINQILPRAFSIELYYFFAGLLGSYISVFMLTLFKFKASMHSMALTALTIYSIGLSIHFEINITYLLSILIIVLGSVISSRLYLKAHNYPEIIIGIIMGGFPQLLTFNSWL